MADDSTLSPPRPNVSIDRYRNSRGLDSRLLGNLDLEHAIGIPCLDGDGRARRTRVRPARGRPVGSFSGIHP